MSEEKPQNPTATEVAESSSENPEAGHENPPEDSAEQSESVSQPAEHTVESGGIQAKDEGFSASGEEAVTGEEPVENNDEIEADEAAGKDSLLGRLEKKYRKVDDQMVEKERLILAAVDQRIPEPYHMSWRAEVNLHFSLIVRIKNRRQRAREAEKEAS